MIALVFILNYAISWFNAWGCGKTWNETKHVGGFAHFMNWMGAVMAASGFTWCYLVLVIFFGSSIPMEHDDGTVAPYFTPEHVRMIADLGYLVIIVPILGSGLAITIHSWAVFWRRKNITNGAVAGWNSFAQVYNTASALQHVPGKFKSVSSFFSGDDNKGQTLVLVAVVACAFAGILQTWWIITSTAKSTAQDRFRKHTWDEELAR